MQTVFNLRRSPTPANVRAAVVISLLSLLLVVVPQGSAGQSAPNAPIACSEAPSTEFARLPLYCTDLIATPEFPEASGRFLLQRPDTPFGVAVTREGRMRYRIQTRIEGLPPPESLGDYTTYVAWATTPVFLPVKKLGAVTNGRTRFGVVTFNKFLILVTAEAHAGVAERSGPLVLRGRSPSMRMHVHDVFMGAPTAMIPPPPEPERPEPTEDENHHAHDEDDGWTMPPMHPVMSSMPPGMHGRAPDVTPYLPDVGPLQDLPEAEPRRYLHLADGDTIRLAAYPVRKQVAGKTIMMYGFNGQIPGPLMEVPAGATITAVVTNDTELPTAVHWHGIRLDNRFDGVPGVTQEAIPPGGSFTYRVYVRDAGIYWYHPHHREDIQQDLGLYGNILARPEEGYPNPVNREAFLMLDDLLLGSSGHVPYGDEAANFALMGRFGNVFIVNGEPRYELTVRRGAVVRFFLTNVANTRTFNLSFDGARVKVIGSDLGLLARETWSESVVLGPAERYVVEVLFDKPGAVELTNRVQAINHRLGRFFSEVDTLGVIEVLPEAVSETYETSHERLGHYAPAAREIDAYRSYFDRPIDHELVMTMETEGLPLPVKQLMRLDAAYANPVEWSGTMTMMNWLSTGKEVEWILRDPETQKENMNIDWRFERGEVIKLRVTNDLNVFHPMQHPLHIHGQRFLVLSQNGEPNEHLLWKDTILIPAGSTAELLVELDNPGDWMIHCHIAEHLSAGMKMVMRVAP